MSVLHTVFRRLHGKMGAVNGTNNAMQSKTVFYDTPSGRISTILPFFLPAKDSVQYTNVPYSCDVRSRPVPYLLKKVGVHNIPEIHTDCT